MPKFGTVNAEREIAEKEKEFIRRGLDAEKQDLRQQGYAAGMRNNEESSLEAYGAGRNEGEMAGLGELGGMMREERAAEGAAMEQAGIQEEVDVVMRMLSEGMDPGYIQGAVESGQIRPEAAQMAMQQMQAQEGTGGAQASSVGGGMPGMEGPNQGLTEGAMRLAAEVMQSQNQPAQGEAPVNVGPLG